MSEIAALQQQLRVEQPIPLYDASEGDGIIYVGGGKYWPGIAVGIKLLRRMGCMLPVEVWYRGQCEQVVESDVEGLGVTFHDVDELGSRHHVSTIPIGNAGAGGWEAKLTAMLLTRFSRVLYLDADAYCVADPTELVAQSSTCLSFWKDLPSQERSIKWDRVWPEGKMTAVPQIQGGQLIIDRIKGWKVIHLANYMCQNSAYFFRAMYGDQDTWRVALSMLKNEATWTNLGKAEWQAVAFVCKKDNTPHIVHRCQGKLFEPRYIPAGRVKYSNPHYALPREAEVFTLLAEVLNSRDQDAGDVFREIYTKRLWGGQPSGAGSKLREAQLYIDTVNRLARENGWRSAVDCGCGDGLVSTRLEFESYVGLDCESTLVINQCHRLKGTHIVGGKVTVRDYLAVDFYKSMELIPAADVLLCKDVLHHWPTEWVIKWLDWVTAARRWQAIVLCQDDKQHFDSQDCPLGGYRALSLTMHPLNRYPLINSVKVHHKTLALILRRE